ncbi:MAG: insulinase family protein [Acidobacteria bacterium]|nr:insulinase family protein [Acidobacteriota bacterium]
MSHVRSVSVGVWIRSGSRLESPPENGISHFIEHMLFKGTRQRSAEDLARAVDSIGGNLDAFTSKELVGYNTKVLDEHLPRAFDILSDLVLNPAFREEDIEKEKGVILEELKMETDNPEYLVHEIFCSNFWKGHPLGQPILGTRETIGSFNRQMIDSYYGRIYVPANILLTAAGNLSHRQIVDLARERFEPLATAAPLPAPVQPETHARLVTRGKKALEQTHLCLGVPCYPLPHEKRFVCYVLNTMLGGGMSSRLFQNIRERQGLAYSVFSELNLYRDSGALMVYAGTSAESAPKVVSAVLQEFSSLKCEPIPDEELRRAKDHLKGSLMLGLESTSSRMANLARQELFFGRFFSLDDLLDSVERVTAEEVRDVARAFFDSRQIAVTVLGKLNGHKFTRTELAC